MPQNRITQPTTEGNQPTASQYQGLIEWQHHGHDDQYGREQPDLGMQLSPRMHWGHPH